MRDQTSNFGGLQGRAVDLEKKQQIKTGPRQCDLRAYDTPPPPPDQNTSHTIKPVIII